MPGHGAIYKMFLTTVPNGRPTRVEARLLRPMLMFSSVICLPTLNSGRYYVMHARLERLHSMLEQLSQPDTAETGKFKCHLHRRW